jgi:YtkA-like
VKALILLLCAAGLVAAQNHEGNFIIRVEPTADLQTKVQVPFAIRVVDDRHKPVLNATVTLQIETQEKTEVKVFKASATDPGTYVAKPIFPSKGDWSVYVEVHRGERMSARTLDVHVPESASP